MHEAQLHEQNSFITLTYDDEHLPPNGSLRYRDFQLFMKRYRKYFQKTRSARISASIRLAHQLRIPPSADMGASPPSPLRFYAAGEYGDKRQRPHFHACIFGHDWEDKKYFTTTKAGAKLYTSEKLKQLWAQGHATTGALTFESAAYTARYIMKKITGDHTASYEKIDPETGEIIEQRKEFNTMSRRPGIGQKWLTKFATDVYPDGAVIINGHKARPPRYYDKYFKELDELAYEQMQYQRHQENIKRSEHNTDERLAVREKVLIAQTSTLKRKLT